MVISGAFRSFSEDNAIYCHVGQGLLSVIK